MSADLYEVLSLAARYLFTLLGVLIVLRAFVWLLTDRAEKKRRIRSLPDTGMVGELVLLSGADDLGTGSAISVPWEGVLGSVRSCDIFLPAQGVKRRHLSFSFLPGQGLMVHPFSGCDAYVNDMCLTCRDREDAAPMVHGSFLRVGSALLRLRLFAGMDVNAGFDNAMPQNAAAGAAAVNPEWMPDSGNVPIPLSAAIPERNPDMGNGSVDSSGLNQDMYPDSGPLWNSLPDHADPEQADSYSGLPNDPSGHPESALFNRPENRYGDPSDSSGSWEANASMKPSRRTRRSDRWEADWSE